MMTLVNNQGRKLYIDFIDGSGPLGPSLNEVMELAKNWPGDGLLYATQRVKAPDPLGSRRDFAVMMASRGYSLPQELDDLLPPIEPIPEGAVA